MAHTKGGNGGGKSKNISAEENKIARQAAKAKQKQRRGKGRDMHAATFTGSAQESKEILTENRLPNTIDMIHRIIDEMVAGHRAVVKEQKVMEDGKVVKPAVYLLDKEGNVVVKPRFTKDAIEGMRAYTYLYFEDSEENREYASAHPIKNWVLVQLQRQLVLVSEVHFVGHLFRQGFDWYSPIANSPVFTAQVKACRWQLKQAAATEAAA